MGKCKKCGEEFTPSKGLVNYCSLQCRNSRTFSEDTRLKKSESAKKSEKVLEANRLIGKSLIKERVERKCLSCNKIMQLKPSSLERKYCSNECFKKSDILKNNGGYRKGSGIGKKGWYKGYWCDSSWELAFIIYNLEHNIKVVRNKDGFKYSYKNKEYKYYPDFIIDGVYYEIKGYMTEKTIEKMNQFNGKLKILAKNEIKPMIDYVIKKYGFDYIKLYDDNPYEKLTKKCLICDKPCKEKNVVCSRICSGKLVKLNTVKKLNPALD